MALHAALKSELAARGLALTEARACTSSCVDACWAGPIVTVAPDGVFYGRVTVDDVPEIVEALAQGRIVDRLVLGPNEFDAKTAGPMLPELPPSEG